MRIDLKNVSRLAYVSAVVLIVGGLASVLIVGGKSVEAANNPEPVVTVATKTETYDISCQDTTNGKFGELTVTVRKYTNMAGPNSTWYEIDDDFDFVITNNSYKSRNPVPMGDEDIPIYSTVDRKMAPSLQFAFDQQGEPQYSTGTTFDGKWFVIDCAVIASGGTFDMDDWWDDPSDTTGFEFTIYYFNDESNYSITGGYADWFEGKS